MNHQEVTERLKENRKAILQAELAGYLHVVNRLDEEFPRPRRQNTPYRDDRVVKPVSIRPEFLVKFALEDKQFEDWLKNEIISPAATEEKSAARRLRSFLTDSTAGTLSTDEEQTLNKLSVNFPGEQWPLGDLVTLWNKPFTHHNVAYVSRFLRQPACNALLLFRQSHAEAAKLKADLTGGQKLERISTVFGWEEQVCRPTKRELEELISSASGFVDQRRSFITKWRRISSRCFAHDTRPANDISVWEYGAAVAAFFKAAAANVWIEGKWPDWSKLNWSLLAVGYPGLEFIGQAVRISDTLARKTWIQGKLDQVRERFEDELPLGNEIYRDENGALFLAAQTDAFDVGAWAKQQVQELAERDDDLAPFVKGGYNRQQDGLFPIWDAIQDLKERRPLALEQFQNWWKTPPQVVCPVCGLRPQGTDKKAGERSLCEVCLTRRERRSEKWLGQSEAANRTIWIDEASDQHGICALLVGRLDLKGWLEADDRKNYFSALALDQQGAHKKPDFMRVQSSWETTHSFWEEVTGALVDGSLPRYRIRVRQGSSLRELHNAHVYETNFRGGELSLVWSAKDRWFVTVLNCEHYKKQIDLSEGEDLREALAQAGHLSIRVPRGYMKDDAGRYHEREREDKKIQVTVESAEDHNSYQPIIPILSEPRHFLAIIPGAKAPDACRKIADLYRDQFGKVRTLLPLTMAVVFFDRRTHIYAVMQAGQKLLRIPSVHRICRVINPSGEDRGLRAVTDQDDVPWRSLWVSAADDPFYARVLLHSGTSKPIAKLVPADLFSCQVSQFDFTHLETTGHRYRIAYDSDGRRLDSEKPTRAFSLEGFEEVGRVWRLLHAGLTSSQINSLFAAVEQKREDWGLNYPIHDHAFKSFVEAVNRETEWAERPPEERLHELTEAICAGLFRDAIELHMKILKAGGRKEQISS